jgi:ApeA N-terminal domain 1/Apea-like HEPN
LSDKPLAGGVGQFWLPTAGDDQVAGYMGWDDDDGATVTLLGTFQGMKDDLWWEAEVIHGRVGIREYTLQDCDATVETIYGPTTSVETTVRARAVLDGALVDGPADAALFRGVTFRVATADDWLDRTGPTVEPLHRGTRVSYEMDDDDAAGPWTVSAGLAFSASRQPTSLRLDRELYYQFAPEPHVSLAEALEAVQSVESITSLAIGVPQQATDVVLGHPTAESRVSIERTVPRSVRLYRRRERRGPAKARPRRVPHFQLPDLGGVAGLARWHDRHPATRSVAALLGAVQAGHLPYLENELLANVLAAELLDRQDFPNSDLDQAEFDAVVARISDAVDQADRELVVSNLRYANEPRLVDRLRRLATRVDPERHFLPVKPGRWAQTAAGCRNRLTHGSGLCDDDRTEPVYWVSQSIWWITAANLVHLVSESAGQKLLAGREANHIFAQLPHSLSAIEPYLASASD